MLPKSPVIPTSRVGTQLLNFPGRREIARFMKRGLSRRPNSDQSLYGVLSRSYGVFVGDSLRSHDAFTALTVHALRFHMAFASCADGVLKTQWHLQERHTCTIALCKRHGRPRRLHNDHFERCARPRSSCCVVGDLTAPVKCTAMVTLIRPHSKCAPLLGRFYAIP